MTEWVAAYDVGRSFCRAALFLDGERTGLVTERTGSTLIDVGGLEAVANALRRAAERLPRRSVRGAALGLAGLGPDQKGAVHLSEVLQDIHGDVPTVVANDATTAHVGALGGEPGVVVLAGTGSVTLGVRADGGVVQVDGWGYLLGDAGSGFSIGRAGLEAALRDRDGRGAHTALTGLAEHRFGALAQLPGRLHAAQDTVRCVASFAEAVGTAAHDGDTIALGILTDAADQLAHSICVAVDRFLTSDGADAAAPSEEVPVSWAGGLLAGAGLLLDPLRAELEQRTPHASLVAPAGDALSGAALLLTRRRPTCHERNLVHRGGPQAHPNDKRQGRTTVSRMGEG